MKKLLIALAAVLVTAATYGQGFVNFNTRVTGGIDAPINFNGAGPGPSYSAALFLVNGNTYTVVPESVTTFRSGAGAAYISGKVAAVPGVPAGTAAQFVIRAWDTAAGSYDAAAASTTFAFGQSTQFSVTPTAPPAFPADLPASVTGFNLTIVPEPTTLALGALGAAVLLFRRRK